MPNRKNKLEKAIEDTDKVIEKLKDLADEKPDEPYVNDAKAFLQQGVVCLKKQVLVEVS